MRDMHQAGGRRGAVTMLRHAALSRLPHAMAVDAFFLFQMYRVQAAYLERTHYGREGREGVCSCLPRMLLC